tara:strand:+ start:96 stop:737 length:642 start_codon:yes stop_codon:yes gene_type:complete
MNKNKIHTLWPIFIGEFHNPNHQEIKKDLIEFFNKYESNNNSREGSENYDLFESNYFLHKENNSALSKVINFIAEGFLTMTKNVNKAELNKIENKEIKLNVKIKNSWFIKYNKGGMVTPHDHGDCSLSCVYYVQVGKEENINNGSTYFLRPFNRGSSHDDFAGIRYNKAVQMFGAEEGKLLIWPSFMLHGSKPYTGAKNRIIISANADVSINK